MYLLFIANKTMITKYIICNFRDMHVQWPMHAKHVNIKVVTTVVNVPAFLLWQKYIFKIVMELILNDNFANHLGTIYVCSFGN